MGWFRRSAAAGDEGGPSFEERLAQISPGVPGHCPECDGVGYIDSIDIGHRYQIQHCKACQHRWEYLFDSDGAVVGLTELDDAGQPVTRSRIRPDRTTPAPDESGASPGRVALPVDDPDDPDELDLRDPPDAPVLDLTETQDLSPAEWLRRSLRS